jgi:hypothetical protein
LSSELAKSCVFVIDIMSSFRPFFGDLLDVNLVRFAAYGFLGPFHSHLTVSGVRLAAIDLLLICVVWRDECYILYGKSCRILPVYAKKSNGAEESCARATSLMEGALHLVSWFHIL